MPKVGMGGRIFLFRVSHGISDKCRQYRSLVSQPVILFISGTDAGASFRFSLLWSTRE